VDSSKSALLRSQAQACNNYQRTCSARVKTRTVATGVVGWRCCVTKRAPDGAGAYLGRKVLSITVPGCWFRPYADLLRVIWRIYNMRQTSTMLLLNNVTAMDLRRTGRADGGGRCACADVAHLLRSGRNMGSATSGGSGRLTASG